jgi:predicted GNAT superfamily acetyltransferase
MTSLELRPIEDVEAFRACEDLQAEVWGYTDREVVPKNELIAAVRAGGSLVGAFEGGTLVGFAYGMAGIDERGPYLSSRLLAVKGALRSQGLGERLKRAQRDDARKKGYKRVRWTQDPLQAANARLNFGKLGATARSYVVDYYGTTSSPLHGSLPTDRLEVEWDLEGPSPVSPAATVSILDAEGDRPGEPSEAPAGVKSVLLSVPPAFTKLIERDRDLALEWRFATRNAFQAAFADGFAVVGFESAPRDAAPFARYVLVR